LARRIRRSSTSSGKPLHRRAPAARAAGGGRSARHALDRARPGLRRAREELPAVAEGRQPIPSIASGVRPGPWGPRRRWPGRRGLGRRFRAAGFGWGLAFGAKRTTSWTSWSMPCFSCGGIYIKRSPGSCVRGVHSIFTERHMRPDEGSKAAERVRAARRDDPFGRPRAAGAGLRRKGDADGIVATVATREPRELRRFVSRMVASVKIECTPRTH